MVKILSYVGFVVHPELYYHYSKNKPLNYILIPINNDERIAIGMAML